LQQGKGERGKQKNSSQRKSIVDGGRGGRGTVRKHVCNNKKRVDEVRPRTRLRPMLNWTTRRGKGRGKAAIAENGPFENGPPGR